MNKGFAALILACLLAVLPGCGSEEPGGPDVFEPIDARQKDPVDMGPVRMVTGGYWSLPDFIDEERSEQILKLICERIKQQRNISMDLQIVRGDNFHNYVITQAASGDPPEILVRVANDRSPERMPDPLRLNEAIQAYGHNLGKIPEHCWALSRIGGSVVSIPSVGLEFHTIAVNNDVLQRNVWTAPSSAAEFEQLLESAKAKGIRPVENFTVGMFWEWFGLPRQIDYPSFMLLKDGQGKLHSAWQSPGYESWLSIMRSWAEKGYFVESNSDEEDGNWLARGMGIHMLAKTPNAVPVKPLFMAAASPATEPALHIKYCFESFNKPEALVTLMDWAYESQQNHTLIALGEEGTDYETMGEAGYRLVEDYKWEFQEYLSMGGFLGNGIRDCVNYEGIKQAETDSEAFAQPDLYVTLPPETWRYALPQSKLLKAWEDLDAYSLAMQDAAYQYILGSITREDYDSIAKEKQPLIDGCIKMVQDYLDKTYDPLEDMYVPAQPGGGK